MQEILTDKTSIFSQQAEITWKGLDDLKQAAEKLDKNINSKLLGKNEDTNIFMRLKRLEENLQT